MIVSLIAALDQEGGIGKAGGVPWHLNSDLQRFKKLTWGHHIILGRKTYGSIGRVLPGRINLVVTRQPDYPLLQQKNLVRVNSIEAALALAEAQGEMEAFVIGGGEIYRLALPRADRLYLTYVQTCAGCDVFFPTLDLHDWIEVSSSHHPADEKNDYPSIFTILERKLGFVPQPDL